MEIPRPPFFRNLIPRASENEALDFDVDNPPAYEEEPNASSQDAAFQLDIAAEEQMEDEPLQAEVGAFQLDTSLAEQTENDTAQADAQEFPSQSSKDTGPIPVKTGIEEPARITNTPMEQPIQPVQRQNESIPQKPSPANTRSRHLSSAEAAEELGVTRHQIAMLARNDEINATMVSGVLLIDPFSLRQYKQLKRGNGRPISPDVAWAMLWMLSGLDAPWLDYQQRRRAILKLREIEAPDLVWQTRKRSKQRVFYTSTNLFGEIGTRLTLSGKSTDRPDIFGMPRNTHELEGYADEETLDALIEQYDLHEDISGNLLVHCAVSTPWRDDIEMQRHSQMPVAAVACDLAASLDPREAHAGLQALEILLGGFRRLSA